MIKKILFILFILFISIVINGLLKYDNQLIIAFSDYEIRTTIGFIIFLTFTFLLSFYLCLHIIHIISYPNLNYYKKKNQNYKNKVDRYSTLIAEGFIFLKLKNTKDALKKLKRANKILKETDLSKFLESQIYYTDKNFEKSDKKLKEIDSEDMNLDLMDFYEKLDKAKKENKVEKIIENSKKIIVIQPSNEEVLKTLYSTYIKEKKWEEAYLYLNMLLKIGAISVSKKEDEVLFLYTSLGKFYYDNQDFFKAKKFLRMAYKININYVQADILLIRTYIAINKKSKAMDVIKKVWKNNSNMEIANLYTSLLSNKDKNSVKSNQVLYKINSKSFESNLLMSKAYLDAKLYSKARKYAKIAEGVKETKDLYEIMLQIEQEDSGSSALLHNLRNKLLALKNSCWKCDVCSREYFKWQPECGNCGNINSLHLTE